MNYTPCSGHFVGPSRLKTGSMWRPCHFMTEDSSVSDMIAIDRTPLRLGGGVNR